MEWRPLRGGERRLTGVKRYGFFPLPMKALSLLLLPLAISQAHGALIVNDTFADGGRTNGADPLDVSWFKPTTGSTLTVENDTTFGSNALKFDPSTTLSSTVAAMPTVSLQVGETLRLTVTFRFDTNPTQNLGGALRIGLYTNNGGETLGDTAGITDDGSGHKADGYYAAFPSGPANAATDNGNGYEIFRETEDNNAILVGTRTGLGTPTVTTPGATGTGIHTATFEITRNSNSITFLSYFQKGSDPMFQAGTGTDASSTITSFDMIAIGTGNNTSTLLIDSVSVELIPEPSSMLLGMLGALSLLGVRRR